MMTAKRVNFPEGEGRRSRPREEEKGKSHLLANRKGAQCRVKEQKRRQHTGNSGMGGGGGR